MYTTHIKTPHTRYYTYIPHTYSHTLYRTHIPNLTPFISYVCPPHIYDPHTTPHIHKGNTHITSTLISQLTPYIMHVYTPHTYASHTYIQDTCIILTTYTRPQILTEYTTPYTISISHPHCKRATCKHTHAKLYILTPHIPTPYHSHTHTTARYTHHTRAHRHSTTVTSHT